MKKKQLKVIYKNKGIANFYGSHIEINKNLKYNKPLRDYIIKHELGHSEKFDLGYEFYDGFRLLKNYAVAKMLIIFFIKNPSTWIDLIPIQINNKKLVYDINLISIYLILILSILFLFTIF